MLRRLKKAEKACRHIKETGGTIGLYLQLPGSVNNGDTIEPALLNEMAQLGIEFLIEVFPHMIEGWVYIGDWGRQ